MIVLWIILSVIVYFGLISAGLGILEADKKQEDGPIWFPYGWFHGPVTKYIWSFLWPLLLVWLVGTIVLVVLVGIGVLVFHPFIKMYDEFKATKKNKKDIPHDELSTWF